MTTAQEDKIFDVAKQRFDRFGYKKTTMDEICKDLQISKKTIYQYFKTKEDLFVGLFIREALAARKDIFQRLGDVGDPLQKLKRIMQVAFEYFGEDSFMVRVLQNTDGLYSPFLNKRFQSLVEEGMINIIVGILEEGYEKGVFRQIDGKLMGYILFKLSQAFTYARTIDSEKDTDYEVTVLIDFITRGLLNPTYIE